MKYPTLKVICTDVKEGAEAFGLIPDLFDDLKLTSFQTMRMIRFGHLHNSRSGDCDEINELNRSPHLMRRTLDDRNFVFTLKHKNEGLPLEDFIEKAMTGQLPPYLETDHDIKAEGEVHTVNRENVPLNKANYTVIVAGS